MYILLIAATNLEIQPAIDCINRVGSRMGGHTIQVLITGVGSVSTAYRLTRRIGESRPDLILQAGIAGCFEGGKTGELVAIQEEILADMGVWENGLFRTLFDMQLTGKNESPFTHERLVNPFGELLSATGLETVRAISVNEISTNKDRIQWYQQNWSPVIESMEGAAFHFVCISEKIPFLQIRAISNQVGERDKSKWDFPTAIHRLNEKLVTLLQELK